MSFDDYSSHLPVFEMLFRNCRVGDALEFGMGKYSTPFLAAHCGRLVSVEQLSREWYEATVANVRAANWEPCFERDPAVVFDRFDNANRRFDLVFSDGEAETRCQIANLAMRRGIPFVVLHDAEKIWYYRWHLLDIPPKYQRFNFRATQGAGKVTTLLTTTGHKEIEAWRVPLHERVVHAYLSPSQPVIEIKL